MSSRFAQELEELHALAQAAHQHVARGQHLAHDLGDLGGAEIELLVEVLHRLEDLGVAEMRIVERRDLRAVIGQTDRRREANQPFSLACL